MDFPLMMFFLYFLIFDILRNFNSCMYVRVCICVYVRIIHTHLRAYRMYL